MDLVRDLLDKKVVDRNGREIGRVDSVVLENGRHGPVRVSAIEIGPAVLAYRPVPPSTTTARWCSPTACGPHWDDGLRASSMGLASTRDGRCAFRSATCWKSQIT